MKQQGFSLIELMISMVIGLLLIAAAGSVYLSQTRATQAQLALEARTTAMSELASFLRKEVHRAGFGMADPTQGLTVTANGVRIRYQAPGAVTLTDYTLRLDTDTNTIVRRIDDMDQPLHERGHVAEVELQCLDRDGGSTACAAGDQPLGLQWVFTLAADDNASLAEREFAFTTAAHNLLLATAP